jgi:hypothetical protein
MGGWSVLSRGAEGTGVSRCPEGHIHVDCGVVTLRFDDEGFLAFTKTIGEAAGSIAASRRPELGGVIRGPMGAWFSLN